MRTIKTEKSYLVEELAPNSVNIVLDKFVTSNGEPINYEDFGSKPKNIVVKQGSESETIKFDNITREPNSDITTLHILEREISDKFPYEGQPTGKKFRIGATAFIALDPETLDDVLDGNAGGVVEGDFEFNGDVKINKDPVEPNDAVNVEYLNSVLESLEAGENEARVDLEALAGEDIPADTVVRYKAEDGKIYIADKDDDTISELTVFAYAENEILEGTAGKVFQAGETPKIISGYTGAVYLGNNGQVETTPDDDPIIIGKVIADSYFNISSKAIKQNDVDARKGDVGYPSDINRFKTEYSDIVLNLSACNTVKLPYILEGDMLEILNTNRGDDIVELVAGNNKEIVPANTKKTIYNLSGEVNVTLTNKFTKQVELCDITGIDSNITEFVIDDNIEYLFGITRDLYLYVYKFDVKGDITSNLTEITSYNDGRDDRVDFNFAEDENNWYFFYRRSDNDYDDIIYRTSINKQDYSTSVSSRDVGHEIYSINVTKDGRTIIEKGKNGYYDVRTLILPSNIETSISSMYSYNYIYGFNNDITPLGGGMVDDGNNLFFGGRTNYNYKNNTYTINNYSTLKYKKYFNGNEYVFYYIDEANKKVYVPEENCDSLASGTLQISVKKKIN